MRSMFGPFGMDPFALAPQIQPHRAARRQPAVVMGCSFIAQMTLIYCLFILEFKLSLFILGWPTCSLWNDGDGE